MAAGDDIAERLIERGLELGRRDDLHVVHVRLHGNIVLTLELSHFGNGGLHAFAERDGFFIVLAVHRPQVAGQAVDAFLRGKRVLINILRHVRHENAVHLQNVEQAVINGRLTALARLDAVNVGLIESFLADLHVIVAEILPEKVVDLVPRGADLIFVEQADAAAHGLLAAFHDPLVNGQQLDRFVLVVIVQMREREFGRVPELRQKALGDLQLIVGKIRVGAQLGVRRPVTDAVRAELFHELVRGFDGVALGFADLFALLRQHEAANHNVAPRHLARVIQALGDGVKRPGADDLMRLRAHGHGRERVGNVGAVRLLPVRVDLRGHGRGRPRVKHGGFGHEFGAAAFTRRLGRDLQWVDRQNAFIGKQRLAALFAVPHRERHAEIALTGNAPVPLQVFDPHVVTVFHEGRVPVDLVARLGEQVAVRKNVDIPLTAGQNFDRLAAALVRLHGVHQLLDLFQQPLLLEQTQQLLARAVNAHARHVGHAFVDAPLGGEHLAVGQVVLFAPFHVGLVAVSGAHDHAGALVEADDLVREDRHLVIEHGHDRFFAHVLFIALILGINE